MSPTLQNIGDIRWHHPSTNIISGPSSSGKSTLVGKILSNLGRVFNPTPCASILFYSQDQKIYDEWLDCGILNEKILYTGDTKEFIELVERYYTRGGCVIIFDDLMLQVEQNVHFFNEIFTVTSHQKNAQFFSFYTTYLQKVFVLYL